MRSFRRILCLIGGVWHHQHVKIRFRLNPKRCSSGGEIRFRPSPNNIVRIRGDFGSAKNIVIRNGWTRSGITSKTDGSIEIKAKTESAFGCRLRCVVRSAWSGSLFFLWNVIHTGRDTQCHRDRGAGWADPPASAERQLIDLHTGGFFRVTRAGRHGRQKVPFLF